MNTGKQEEEIGIRRIIQVGEKMKEE